MDLPPDYFWGDLIREYLHDPPDKPLDIKGHAARGRRYAEIVVGREISAKEHQGEGAWSDQRASQVERLPLPNAGENYHRAVGVDNGKLRAYHPLSGKQHEIDCPSLQADEVEKILRSLAPDHLSMPARYLSLWRLLPQNLNALHPAYLKLPAETRIPDHTVWNHLDTTAAFYSAYARSRSLAFVSFVVGPVQPFIAAARSLKDLWSGSMMLSQLSFASLTPILKQCGPTALVFPQLRGNALMDQWMRQEHPALQDLIPEPSAESLRSPCLPNRWVALVPESIAEDIVRACREAFYESWKEISDFAHELFSKSFSALDPLWDDLWDQQVNHFFELNTQVLPWNACDDESVARLLGHETFESAFPEVQKIRDLANKIPKEDRPGYDQDSVGRWQARMDLMGRVLASQRMERNIPLYNPVEQSKHASFAPKCSLMGNIEQMGPPILNASAQFWQKAAKTNSLIKDGERFGAVALVKRAYPRYFSKKFSCRMEDLRLDDTATVAATAMLSREKLDISSLRKSALDAGTSWSGQWLHGREDNPPEIIRKYISTYENRSEIPAYYAILVMDGDHMGQWLQGQKTPSLRQIMHTDIVEYFRRQGIEKELDVRRAVSPALHASISEALGNFSLQLAPSIVDKHQGTLVYAGGDDVLALLPLETALDCAKELYQAFRGDTEDGSPDGYVRHKGRDWLTMGTRSTVSAGLTVVHYKEDLRVALETARQAESFAKNRGRDQLTLQICRHSGEWCNTPLYWDEIDDFQALLKLFLSDGEFSLTNRWAYRLRQMSTDFQRFESDEPVESEIRRQMKRIESNHQLRLAHMLSSLGLSNNASEGMVELFQKYAQKRREQWASLAHMSSDDVKPYRLLESFSLLCQSLSFMARGRDE